jgi:hypothetical protein
MGVALAVTYHDPQGRLCEQIQRVLPTLVGVFARVAVRASRAANARALSLFADAGALVKQASAERSSEAPKLGAARREAVALAVELDTPFVLYCDGDRILHWAERYPQELAQVVTRLPENDLTILGRTKRAFDSHPRAQRDTEAIVNHVFQAITGCGWDVMAAARGLSRPACKAILDRCFDEEISTDVSWPLCLRALGTFSMGYIATEGLEFETPARYAKEIAAVGGYEAWLKRRDADPKRWLHRLDFARAHLEAMIPFAAGGER